MQASRSGLARDARMNAGKARGQGVRPTHQSSRSHAVRVRSRSAIARGICSRGLAVSGGPRSHTATQACGQLGRDDLGQDVVEKRELARHLAPPAYGHRHRIKPAQVVCELGTSVPRAKHAVRAACRHPELADSHRRAKQGRAAQAQTHARKGLSCSPMRHPTEAEDDGLSGVSSS